MINLTSGQVQRVTWPGYPKLFGPFVRIVAFSNELKCWIALVPKRSAQSFDGCLEVEPTDMERIRLLQASGFSNLDALKRVLGV